MSQRKNWSCNVDFWYQRSLEALCVVMVDRGGEKTCFGFTYNDSIRRISRTDFKPFHLHLLTGHKKKKDKGQSANQRQTGEQLHGLNITRRVGQARWTSCTERPPASGVTSVRGSCCWTARRGRGRTGWRKRCASYISMELLGFFFFLRNHVRAIFMLKAMMRICMKSVDNIFSSCLTWLALCATAANISGTSQEANYGKSESLLPPRMNNSRLKSSVY